MRALRRILGDDEFTLVCISQSQHERWRYSLVGNADDAASRFWQANRIGDVEARLETIQHVTGSISHGTDGRTTVGRKARMIASTVTHLRETLAVIAEAAICEEAT